MIKIHIYPGADLEVLETTA